MPNIRTNPQDPDSPFLTKEFFRDAKTFKERFPHVDTSNPAIVRVEDDGTRQVIENSAKVLVPLSSDLVRRLRDTGPEWEAVAEDILRSGLEERQSKAA